MREFITAIRIFLVLSVLTGIVYPLVVTGIAQLAFKEGANGSLIRQGDNIVGSRLVGQPFDDPKYFWSRPSSTGSFPYNAAASSGSNMGPLSGALIGGGTDEDGKRIPGAIADRVAAIRNAETLTPLPQKGEGELRKVPTDLVTASGSGLDPHISPEAAEFQVSRVAKVRSMTADSVRELVKKHTESRQFGFLGEPIVNVLELNLALDDHK